ncbi:T-cell differentiation antigen CD6-like [Crassostrea angulata]|uniref:T-cell differentiation antigen CD6-like n=1 Tax=Magallana angulata TaxID=2784310 RepID=UPI0022B0F639|nr:T-cell differentiation antigen CD6-like [Crassostrea angulata]
MLAFIILIQIGELAVVMSEIGSCPVKQDKVIGKRLPVKWPRVEKNIGFQMCLSKCEAMSYCLSINFNRVLLECELNERKKNDSNDLVDDDSYFYAETVRADHQSNVCGDKICNNYSTCVTMAGNRKVCIETDCSESAPEIHVPNGNIVQRTYSPASITYGCNKDFIGYGTTQTIYCSIGGKWSPLDYRCEHSYTRLVGSNVPFEGRVEVNKYGSWGTVCDDYFGMSEADVVCRSLGFQGALQVTHKYGSGTGAILMDNVNCFSNETTILDCGYKTSHDCSHAEDVGVICKH